MRKIFQVIFGLVAAYLIHDQYNLISTSSKKTQFFYNGIILTMEDEFQTVESIFVENGIIRSIGNEYKVRKFIKDDTEIINLNGKTLIPGFIDSHTHPVASTFLRNMIDLSGFKHKNKEDLWAYFEEQVKHFKPGEWIICKGFDQVLVKDLLSPKITYLDSIAPNNPVFISSLSMHTYWANTLAFNEVGIDENSEDPSQSSFYEKDQYGELTGLIVEQEAFKPFKNKMVQEIGNDILKENIVKVLYDYASNGNTTITSMGITTDDPNIIRAYRHLSSEKSSLIDRFLANIGLLPSKKPIVRHFIFIRNDAPHLLPRSEKNGDDFFKIVGVKFWYDGSPYTGSMYIEQPYLDNHLTNDILHYPHLHCGAALIEKNHFKNEIINYQNKGWQIAIHAQGDKAISEVLDIFESIQSKEKKDFRNRIEHCLLLNISSIKRMSKLNIHPSFHINHLYYYGDMLADKIIGQRRTEKMLPVRSAEQKSLVYSLHADQPMFESKPLSLLHTAVNRQTQNGKKIGDDQTVSVNSALKALTINSAWQIKMENKIGSIKVGKYADFVILDKNPLKVPQKEIKNINVLQTIVNGNTIFTKN